MKKQSLQFPEPDPDALWHSRLLTDAITTEIKKCGGRISFARYMEMALVEPGLGYYVSGSQKFGASGDFVTAPEISPLFSYCLGRQCAEILSNLQSAEEKSILEFGAGTGIMAADVLLEMDRLGRLPEHYYILEVSADLKQRQKLTLQERAGELADRVIWIDQLPAAEFCGVVLANEVLDAMPVHRFFKQGKETENTGEFYVACKNGDFAWETGPFSSDQVKNQVEKLSKELPENYSSEINLALRPWVSSVADVLKQGVVLMIDYGFSRREYYHPQRAQGTLMCHYRHRSHTDPFVYPGLQDITAHVDFTAVAEAAYDAGLDILGYTTQAFFLLGNRVETYLENIDSSSVEYMKLSQQLKTLTMPGEMGELFKVMAAGKEYNQPLTGFALKDDRVKL